MLPARKLFIVAAFIMAAASLAYGIFDISQSNLVLGILKLLFAIIAGALGVYYLRSSRVRGPEL